MLGEIGQLMFASVLAKSTGMAQGHPTSKMIFMNRHQWWIIQSAPLIAADDSHRVRV